MRICEVVLTTHCSGALLRALRILAAGLCAVTLRNFVMDVETSGRRERRRRRRKRGTKRARTVRVISWEGVGWGIEIDRGNGRHKAYAVGSREAAEKEVQRIRSGGRARTRKQAAQLLKGGAPI